MDRIDDYRSILHKTLNHYAQLNNDNDQIKSIVIISQDNNQFLLFNEGWEGKKHIHHCLFHGEIKNDKIWVYFDGFEDTITEAIINEGIPKDKIVLAFHPVYVREKTEFAIV
jgi:hypothetical protein